MGSAPQPAAPGPGPVRVPQEGDSQVSGGGCRAKPCGKKPDTQYIHTTETHHNPPVIYTRSVI